MVAAQGPPLLRPATVLTPSPGAPSNAPARGAPPKAPCPAFTPSVEPAVLLTRRRAAPTAARATACALLCALASAAAAQDTAEPDCAASHQRLRERITTLERRLAEMERGRAVTMIEPSPAPRLGLDRRPRVVSRGEVVEQAVGFGVPVDVFGEVSGDAVAVGADVRVHPGARVNGDAVSLGGQVRVLDGGRIGGQPLALTAAAAPPERAPTRAIGLGLSAGAAGVLAAGLWPGRVDVAAARVRAAPWRSAAVGLLAVIAGPGLAIALALTLVGVPLAVVIFAALAAAVGLGGVAAAAAVGQRLHPALSPWSAALLGGLLLLTLWQLPYLGVLAVLGIGLAGLGAAVQSRLGRRA